ncbi:unnamed protein product, partial [Urochloa humidicola]
MEVADAMAGGGEQEVPEDLVQVWRPGGPCCGAQDGHGDDAPLLKLLVEDLVQRQANPEERVRSQGYECDLCSPHGSSEKDPGEVPGGGGQDEPSHTVALSVVGHGIAS